MKGTGELLTGKLVFSGEHFFVNVNVNGSLQVELLDSNGKVIPGFTKSDCKTVKGDAVKQKIEWNGNATLSSLKIKR